MIKLLWFTGTFAGTMLACIAGWLIVSTVTSIPDTVDADTPLAALSDLEIPTNQIADAKNGDRMLLTTDRLSDAIVVLLGALGCSGDQVEVLRWWEEYLDSDSAGVDQQRIFALYADSFVGIERSRYESLLLRRVSGAQFPMLVYEGQEFNLRALGVRTPQVVRVRNGRIVEVLPPVGR